MGGSAMGRLALTLNGFYLGYQEPSATRAILRTKCPWVLTSSASEHSCSSKPEPHLPSRWARTPSEQLKLHKSNFSPSHRNQAPRRGHTQQVCYAKTCEHIAVWGPISSFLLLLGLEFADVPGRAGRDLSLHLQEPGACHERHSGHPHLSLPGSPPDCVTSEQRIPTEPSMAACPGRP